MLGHSCQPYGSQIEQGGKDRSHASWGKETPYQKKEETNKPGGGEKRERGRTVNRNQMKDAHGRLRTKDQGEMSSSNRGGKRGKGNKKKRLANKKLQESMIEVYEAKQECGKSGGKEERYAPQSSVEERGVKTTGKEDDPKGGAECHSPRGVKRLLEVA